MVAGADLAGRQDAAAAGRDVGVAGGLDVHRVPRARALVRRTVRGFSFGCVACMTVMLVAAKVTVNDGVTIFKRRRGAEMPLNRAPRLTVTNCDSRRRRRDATSFLRPRYSITSLAREPYAFANASSVSSEVRPSPARGGQYMSHQRLIWPMRPLARALREA